MLSGLKNDAIVLVGILAATIIGAAIFVMNTMTMQPVYAPPTTCNGCAKDFAPNEDPTIPGWDPAGAPEDAPGHCIGCESKDVSPGQLKQKDIILP
jgi:hypothetical protein